MTTKGPAAFRTISEASDELGVPTHVLRFWETKFSFIRPMKRAGGRRFYRPRDLDVLKGVRDLLHEEGYTIKGVQRLHKEQGVRRLLLAGGASPQTLADAELDLTFEDTPETEPSSDLAPAEPEAESVQSDTALDGDGDAPKRTRPMLTQTARMRLLSILGDLNDAKGAIDALLGAGANDVD